METHITYDTTGKQLGVLVKQRLATSDNLQVKVVGVLNTVSGHFEYCAKFRKYLCPPKANLRAAAASPRDYLLSVGRKAQVGLGLTYLSHTDDILAGLMARKQLLVGPATNPIMLKVKAQADFNTHTAQVDGVGRIQLSKTVYNFTHMQDIQGIIGYKAHCNQKGKVILMPYAQIRENNWTLFFDFKGYIGARYDL
ncbi:g8878 [Coccomyxa viridis]|uniref:G8878 protein n=1 Tax=Coccomyxa viridis TaxID=1274662 RepID=A0ABP1G417_9CHLO